MPPCGLYYEKLFTFYANTGSSQAKTRKFTHTRATHPHIQGKSQCWYWHYWNSKIIVNNYSIKLKKNLTVSDSSISPDSHNILLLISYNSSTSHSSQNLTFNESYSCKQICPFPRAVYLLGYIASRDICL